MLVTQQKVLRRFWYCTMPLGALDAGPRPFTLLGEHIVLWRDALGQPAALQDRCCHRTAKLSKGYCEDGNIVCGYHGWTYDRSGACVRIPQYEPDVKIPSGARVQSYRCEARYGYVWVALDEPLLPIPELEEDADPAFRRIHQFYETWKCSAFRLMENSFDSAHPAFVHRKTFGNVEQPKPVERELTMTPWGFISRHETPVINRGNAEKALRVSGETTVRKSETLWFMPFARRLGITYPNGLKHYIVTNATPNDDGTMTLVQWCYRNDREEEVPAAEVVAWDRQITEEDREILESTEYDVCIDPRRRMEFHMTSDRPGLIMRERLLEMFRQHGEEEAHL
jgi:phenylpropionate dioxygenase-like ring-hydroxylating dioxygenase large terminal subunit